jgi:hypothetical protein
MNFRAFRSFSQHFPTAADSLYNSLDVKTQKLVNGIQGKTFGSLKSLKDGYSNSNAPSAFTGYTNNYDSFDSQNNIQRYGTGKSNAPSNGMQNIFNKLIFTKILF